MAGWSTLSSTTSCMHSAQLSLPYDWHSQPTFLLLSWSWLWRDFKLLTGVYWYYPWSSSGKCASKASHCLSHVTMTVWQSQYAWQLGDSMRLFWQCFCLWSRSLSFCGKVWHNPHLLWPVTVPPPPPSLSLGVCEERRTKSQDYIIWRGHHLYP